MCPQARVSIFAFNTNACLALQSLLECTRFGRLNFRKYRTVLSTELLRCKEWRARIAAFFSALLTKRPHGTSIVLQLFRAMSSTHETLDSLLSLTRDLIRASPRMCLEIK